MRTITLTSSLCVLALALSGCGGSRGYTASYSVAGTTPHATSSRDLRTLSRVASSHMACPEHALQVRPIGGPVWQVAGCGQVREYAIDERGFRRDAWRPVAPVQASAGAQLSCPADAIVVHRESDGVRNVSGCGQSARYELACDARQCSWVMTERSYAGARAPSRRETYDARPGYVPPVIVVPDRGSPGIDPSVDRAVRQSIDASRSSVFACTGAMQPIAVRARWGTDGRVWIALDPPYAGTAAEQCVQQSVGGMRVTSGVPGEILHVVR